MNSIDWSLRRQRCPNCGRDHEQGWRGTLGVTINQDGSAVAHCFRCETVVTNGSARTRSVDGRQIESKPRIHHERFSDVGWSLWNACRSIASDARAYLEARACVIPPIDGHLRYHAALRHPPTGIVGPALVALVTDAITGEPLTLHRTWIRADGRKAPVEPARMLLGGHRKAGGVIRLWPDEVVALGLGVAEGLETALSLAHAITPVWSAIDAGNLAAFPVLAGIESITIAADNDDAGVRAAQACAERWDAAGREVFVIRPAGPNADINDMARAA